MARLREKHLPHRITITPLATETAEGETRGASTSDVPAYVEQKNRLVVDQRTDSPTFMQQITSTAFVVGLPDVVALPRTLVTVWAGTPYERESQVVATAPFDYRGTPNHVELYLE